MRILAVFAVAALLSAVPAADVQADPVTVPVTVSTSGTFHCLHYAPCFAGQGTNQITMTNGSAQATITFTGVNATYQLTNSVMPVTLGSFEVIGTPDFTFPTNNANPALPIFTFLLSARDSGNDDGLWWQFGPGGGTQLLHQVGFYNFSISTDIDPSPWAGMNFRVYPPTLELNTTSTLTADAGLVPEPSTLILIGSGLGALLARRRGGRKLDG